MRIDLDTKTTTTTNLKKKKIKINLIILMKFKVKVMETYKCLRKKREWITNGKIESGGLLDSLPIISIFEANDHRSDQFRG